MSSLKRMLLNILLVNVILFFALIAIHEISHVILGICLGCESEKAVLFDSSFNGPHTELICSNNINEFFGWSNPFPINGDNIRCFINTGA